jgi:hypothetical protein
MWVWLNEADPVQDLDQRLGGLSGTRTIFRDIVGIQPFTLRSGDARRTAWR